MTYPAAASPGDIPSRRPWFRIAVLYLVIWALPAALTASQTILNYRATGGEAQVGAIIRLAVPLWAAWAILAPVVVWAAHRWPFTRRRWLRVLGIHLLINAVVGSGVAGLYLIFRTAVGLPPQIPLRAAIGVLDMVVLTYWVLVGGVQAWRSHRALQDRALREAELARQLTDARLETLRMQLHPHFLFNTLHAIAGVIPDDPETAEDMLGELAEFLRFSLDPPLADEIPLMAEIEFIERYLAIQRLRLGDRLEVEIEMEGPVREAEVPILILQPLVENAIEHGIARLAEGGKLRIEATADVNVLTLRLENPGPPGAEAGFVASDQWGTRIRNTRDRLRQLYGDEGRITVDRKPEGGAVVTVSLPVNFGEAR